MKKKNYHIAWSMDDLKNDERSEKLLSYKNVYMNAATIFLSIIILYTLAIKGGFIGENSYIRMKLFPKLCNEGWFNNVLDFVVEDVLLAALFFGLLTLISYGVRKQWIKKHKGIWLKGYWLHIHEKNNGEVRVGYVNLMQNYDNLDAKGENYDLFNLSDSRKITTWKYYSAQIDGGSELRGFYAAKKSANQVSNTGVHLLTIKNATDNFPLVLKGSFGDTYMNAFNEEHNVAAMSQEEAVRFLNSLAKDSMQHSGMLTLIRMTEPQKEYLFNNGHFMPERLGEMLENDAFKNDEFCNRISVIMQERVDMVK